MSNTLEYILSLNDQMSTKLQKIGISSDGALNKFAKLQQQSNDTKKLLNDMGGSVGSLRAKLELLKAEREWIPASNLNSIRKYNTEIKNLEKEILHLDTINGSVFKRNMKDAISNIPFSNLITNPIVAAGTAMAVASKYSLGFEEGMAKINTTANLSQPKLKELENSLRSMGKDYGADLTKVPEGYEKILSQTGDVSLSLDIMKSALKGSVGGFTDQTIVADALAQSLSLIGKENTTAKEVLDTFFAAKRVGAGEFKDFAQYMPGLIASGRSLGIEFKETAGMFAYMTGKGQSAERSAVLMENAFSALNKMDIRDNLKAEGINVFDETGTIRSINSIFGDLSQKMKGMSDEQKSSFLGKIGLTDKEARSAFIIMTEDNKKLAESMLEVKNAQGETDKAFDKAQTKMQRLRVIFSNLQDLGISFGNVLNTILTPAFDFAAWGIEFLFRHLKWFFDGINNGNPWVLALATAIGMVTIAVNGARIAKWGDIIAQKAYNVVMKLAIYQNTVYQGLKKSFLVVSGLLTGATWAQVAAQNGLNAAMWANPIGIIIALIIGLIAVIAYIIYQTEGWGAAWDNTLGTMKSLWAMTVSGFQMSWLGFQHVFLTGIELIQMQWYKLKSLWDEEGAKQGINKIKEASDSRKKALVEKAAEVNGHTKDYLTYTGKAANSVKWKDKSLTDIKDDMMGKLGMNNSKVVPGSEGELQQRLQNAMDFKSKQKIGSEKYKWAENRIKELQDKLGMSSSPGPANKGAKGLGSRSNDSIATGGTKNTTINITLDNIVGVLTVTGKDFKEAKDKLQTEVTDAVVRALNMGTSTAG